MHLKRLPNGKLGIFFFRDEQVGDSDDWIWKNLKIIEVPLEHEDINIDNIFKCQWFETHQKSTGDEQLNSMKKKYRVMQHPLPELLHGLNRGK